MEQAQEATSGRSHLLEFFWNAETERLRLPWRLALGAVVLVVVLLAVSAVVDAVFAAAVEPLVGLFVRGPTGDQYARLVAVSVQLVVIAAVVGLTVSLAGRFLDRRWLSDFGFRFDRGWWLDLGFGAALGAALLTVVFFVELALGWVTVTGTFATAPRLAFWPWVAFGLANYVTVAVVEELLFRGYLLTNVAEGLTWFDRLSPRRAAVAAVLVTSVLFGLAHVFRPNADLVSTLNIALGDVMFGVAYVLTGELGLLGTLGFVVGTVLILAWVRRREGTLGISQAVLRPDRRVVPGEP